MNIGIYLLFIKINIFDNYQINRKLQISNLTYYLLNNI